MRQLNQRSVARYVLIGLIGVVILLLPFHALMTVWAASNFGHYTLFRLWKEFLILICGLIVIGLLFVDKNVRDTLLKSKLNWLIAAYVLLDLVTGAVAYRHSVSGKALAYGLLDDLRFLAFFIICWAAAINSKYLNVRWQKLVLWPAVIVVGFGLLQMSVLSPNFLAHFGYSASTIKPFETINNNPNYIRILSTLRGADPLGAYLILPLSALVVLLIKFKKSWVWLKLVLIAATIAVLIGSYSRAAWIGALLACIATAAAFLTRKQLLRYKTALTVTVIVLVVAAAGGVVLLGHSKRFQNIIFHTQTNSSAPVSSDQAHLSALKGGIKAMLKSPLGEGPGTSGPASVYNHLRPARIPENYFLEVGEETGWLGLLLFLAINVFVGRELWLRRSSPLALTLFASLIGITFVNLLLLEWTDDTLSYIWWGLAGLAMAEVASTRKTKS